MTRSGRTGAAALMAATALIWSSGGVFIKWVDWNPMAVSGVRSGLAALTLLALASLLQRAGHGHAKSSPASSSRSLGGLRFTFSKAQIGAALGYAGLLITNVAATKLTTSANAILLAYTAPVYVALLAPVFLHERTSSRDWIFIGVTLAGMGLFFLDKLSPGGMWGNVIAVGTGLSYAVFTMCMRAQKSASPVESVILGHALTAVCGLFFMFGPLPDTRSLLCLLYLGIFQQGVSLVLYSFAIKHLGALEAILIMTLEPIFNPVWVALGYGEFPGKWAMVGGVVVIGAVTARGIVGTIRR